MSSIDQVAFPAPRSEAAAELIDAHAALESKLDGLDREQHAAAEALTRASAALVEVEKRELAGDKKPTAAQRRDVETQLAEAKAGHAVNWTEKRQALGEAIGDSRGKVQQFVAANFGVLVEEVEEDGRAAADDVDAAAASLVAAYRDRDRASQRLDALIAVVRGASRFGDVALSRADAAVREAGRMLEQGGEAAPIVRDGIVPRQDVADEQDVPQEVHAA